MQVQCPRFMAVLFVAATGVASLTCSGGGSGGGGGGGGGPTVLFEDTFDGTFPSPNWTAIPAVAQIDALDGVPAASLHMTSGADVVLATSPFSTQGGISFELWIRVDALGTGAADQINFRIEKQAASSIEASVVIIDYIPGFVQHTYTIRPTSGGLVFDNFTDFIPRDNAWHLYRFSVAQDGSARWFRNGAQKLATQPGMVMDEQDFRIRLVAFSIAEAHVDEVLITRP
ncbi:MAG: hypothetical protein O7H41_04860 [Planctomycetota bacterium]|nr:hypothetical protein [Planctomycetota bacterium]